MKNLCKVFLFILIFAVLLTGCLPGTMSFSPQEAALRAANDRRGFNAVVDQSSVQIRQSVSMGGRVFVMISHSQMDGGRQDKCLIVYATERSSIGTWVPRSSGGGCSGTMPGSEEPPPVPMEAMGGTGGGSNPNEPGESYTYGLVNPTETGETIVKVRVTWDDGQQQEAGIVSGSYIAVRAGSFHFQKLEGFNANGVIVHTIDIPNSPMNQ